MQVKEKPQTIVSYLWFISFLLFLYLFHSIYPSICHLWSIQSVPGTARFCREYAVFTLKECSLHFLHNPLDTETVVSLTRTGNISCFLYLEKDQDMLRGCDQGFMTGASDSLGQHGWAWTLNSALLSSMQTQNQIVYFIRQAPVPITPENFEETVQFGTVRGAYIPALLRLLSGVFAPQIFKNTTWPESIRNHFASHLHRFLACLTGEQNGRGACFLPIPHQQQSE